MSLTLKVVWLKALGFYLLTTNWKLSAVVKVTVEID